MRLLLHRARGFHRAHLHLRALYRARLFDGTGLLNPRLLNWARRLNRCCLRRRVRRLETLRLVELLPLLLEVARRLIRARLLKIALLFRRARLLEVAWLIRRPLLLRGMRLLEVARLFRGVRLLEVTLLLFRTLLERPRLRLHGRCPRHLPLLLSLAPALVIVLHPVIPHLNARRAIVVEILAGVLLRLGARRFTARRLPRVDRRCVQRALAILHIGFGRPAAVRSSRPKPLPALNRSDRARRNHPHPLLVHCRSLLRPQRVQLLATQRPPTVLTNGRLLTIK